MFDKFALCLMLIAFVRFEMSEGYNTDDPKELDRLIQETDEQIKKSEKQLKEYRSTVVHASRPKIHAIYNKEDMLRDARTIAYDVLSRYNDPKNITINIRKQFKQKYILFNWHCIMGHDLGFDFAKENNHIQFEVNGFQIVLFTLNRCKNNCERKNK